MACTPITPAEFKAAKCQFVDVANDTVQSYIDLAQVWAGGDWPDRVCKAVQVSVTCHLMTVDGQGSDPVSQSFADGSANYQSVRSGQVTVTRFRSQAEAAGRSTTDWFSQTQCGQMFLTLLRSFRGGPVAIPGGSGRCVTGYAKDAYRDAWWSGC